MATDEGGIYDDLEEEDGFSFSVLLIIVFIVLIWIAILCLLVKLDIGGFGSSVALEQGEEDLQRACRHYGSRVVRIVETGPSAGCLGGIRF